MKFRLRRSKDTTIMWWATTQRHELMGVLYADPPHWEALKQLLTHSQRTRTLLTSVRDTLSQLRPPTDVACPSCGAEPNTDHAVGCPANRVTTLLEELTALLHHEFNEVEVDED